METRRMKLLIIALCAFGLIAGLVASASDYVMDVRTMSYADYETLQNTLAYSTGGDVKGSLCINGFDAPYDVDGQTYYIPQSMNTDALDGELSWSSKRVRAYLVCDGALDKHGLIGSGEPVVLVVTDGESYFERKVVFTGLPMCVFETDEDAQTRFSGSNGKMGGRIRIFEPEGGSNGSYRIRTENITYKRRGNTSRSYDKQQYTVWFRTWTNEPLELQTLGLRKADTIYFYNMYAEESKVRHKLSLRIWEELIAASPERGNYPTNGFTYVEVMQFGDYFGLYGVLDRCSPEDSVYVDDRGAVMYKLLTRLWEDAPDPLHFMPENININRCHSTKIIWPKKMKSTDWNYAIDYADTVFLKGKEAATEDILERAVLENLIDFSLYIQAIAGLDNVELNMFWYARPVGDSYRMYRIPWDMDCTFGKEHNLLHETNMDCAAILYEQREVEALLKNCPEWIGPQLAERWKELREDVLSEETILALLDTEWGTITGSGALRRDSVRWPECEDSADTSEIEAFLRARMRFLDSYYETLA